MIKLSRSSKIHYYLSIDVMFPFQNVNRYLTSKVDRSVTGLVAQQQCVGPIHTPLADVAVVAMSYFDTVGTATAVLFTFARCFLLYQSDI